MKNLCEEQNAAARYIKMEHRSNESALSFDLIRNIQRQKENNSFKGASLLKDPFDEAILRRLIFDIKPMTIFEFGV